MRIDWRGYGMWLLLFATMVFVTVVAFGQAGTHDRFCFPAQAWDGPNNERPCARIVRVYEDGSVHLRVFEANGTHRYSYGIGAPDR